MPLQFVEDEDDMASCQEALISSREGGCWESHRAFDFLVDGRPERIEGRYWVRELFW